jgi:GT2 family glycosyltransferase
MRSRRDDLNEGDSDRRSTMGIVLPDMTGPASSTGVGVVITNYETWDLTCRCLAAVEEAGGVDDVVVVDDASRSTPPCNVTRRARLLVNRENRGLCRSLNLGVEACAADLVVLFDSDAYPLMPFAAPLRNAFASDPSLAAVAFETVDADGAATPSSEAEPDVTGFVLGQRLDAARQRFWPRRAPEERLSVFTCAMAVRKQAFLEVGGFDESFDWLDLDHDLSMRLRQAGHRLTVATGLVAFHEGGGAPQRTGDRVARHYRNRWLLLRKHGKVRHPRLVRLLVGARLSAEAALLLACRALSPRSPRLADALRGRKKALRHTASMR